MKRENINTWIAAGAFVIAILGLAYNYFSDKKETETNYKVIATEKRPELKILGNPDIVSADLYFPYTVEDMVENKCELEEELRVRFDNFKLKINFKNIGLNTANLITEVQIDKYEGSFYLRDLFLGKTEKIETNAFPANDFFENNQIPPNEEKAIEFTSEAKNVKENGFIRHVMLLYENDIGMLFDTYCWISVGIDFIDTFTAVEQHNFSLTLTVKDDDKVINRQYIVMDVLEFHCNSKIYSQEEAEIVTKEVHRICASCKDKKDNKI